MVSGVSPALPEGALFREQAAKAPGRLTAQQQVAVAQLAQIDRRVRAHEQAHLAAAGGLTRGGPSYSYTTGPDGKQYAVGGEVSIDTSPAANPEETIAKAQQIQAAANAPADPSPQDRQVAAAAVQMQIEAQLQIAAQRSQQARGSSGADRRLSAYAPSQDSGRPLLNLIA